VRGNRETVAGELLLTYDPTPGTWMYDWDNDMKMQNLLLVLDLCSVIYLVKMQRLEFFADGRTTFAFHSAPAHDLWESNTRIVSKLTSDFGLIGNIYFGNALMVVVKISRTFRRRSKSNL
jgi:hypothetical protein